MTDIAPRSLPDLEPLAAQVLDALRDRGQMLATAESCTGGLIAGCLTEVAGSSAVVDRGFITYANEAKTEMLGVSADLIEAVGAVSREVAIAMAEGALARSRADVAVSVTGVAGPGGGSEAKPVGTVHIAVACRGRPTRHHHCLFSGEGRRSVRLETVKTAFISILNAVEDVNHH